MTRIIAATLMLWVAAVLPASATDAKILHAISRLSFGPTPGEIERVESIGVEKYIQEQLNPATILLSASLNNKLAALSTVTMSTTELGQIFGAVRKAPAVEPAKVMVINIKKIAD